MEKEKNKGKGSMDQRVKEEEKSPQASQPEKAQVASEPRATPSESLATDPTAQELEKLRKELLYLRADFENYKKRILREQDQAIRFANERLIHELLLVEDHLRRALVHGKQFKTSDNGEATQFVNGIEMTHKELLQLLVKFGVEFVGEEGENFDPARHEAVGQQEVAAAQENLVVELLSRGSLLHGRLLKPARVIVGKAKE